MRWVERYLLNLGEIVLCVLIEHKLANFAERELLLRPDVCQVEDVDLLLLPEILSLLCSHCLNLNRPLGIITTLDGLEEILLRIIGTLVGGILLCDELGALLRLHVKLAVYPVSALIDKLDGVAIIAVHEAIAIWNTTVTHEDHDLVDRLWVLREVIPEHGGVIGVREMSLRITLLGVDEVREFGGVSQKEDWCIVGHDIPVALVCPHLHREASRVPSAVVRTRFATDCRETNSDGTFLALGTEDVCLGQVVRRICAFEVAMSATALSVHNALGNTFAIEVGEEVDQVEVLQEERSILTNALGLVWVRHGDAIAGGVGGFLAGRLAILLI